MAKPIRRSYLFLILAAALLPAFFNACGPNGFHSLQGGISELASTAIAQKRVCESELLAVYENTYHPLMKNNCNFCHSSAHGSNDLRLSFNAFRAKGQATIDMRASTPHGGNSINLSSEIAVVHQPYADAETAYTACMQDNPIEEVSTGVPFNVKEKALAGLSGSFREYSWDLYLESNDRPQEVKATFRIEARTYTYQGTVVGFEFRNPSLQLATGQSAVQVDGLQFTVRSQLQDSVTTYAGISSSISGTTKTMLATGLANAFVHMPGASAAMPVGFQFHNLK